MAVYLDTSAATKLVVSEAGSTSLRRWIAALDEPVVSSDLLRTELLRAVRRRKPSAMTQARAVLDSITLTDMPTSLFERAALLEPIGLRSLDALHIAAALDLGDELSAVVTYDDRMVEAIEALGLIARSPR
ncbi:MAG TPA: type II toxin-antitoxin system VapC family toxin [Microthrixaceae bacterium]|nr:type II toxin-antitoxin system VapC family toxin [Microthrixaceae bacterium]